MAKKPKPVPKKFSTLDMLLKTSNQSQNSKHQATGARKNSEQKSADTFGERYDSNSRIMERDTLEAKSIMTERNMKSSSFIEQDKSHNQKALTSRQRDILMNSLLQSQASIAKHTNSNHERSYRDGHLFAKTSFRLMPIPSLPKIKAGKNVKNAKGSFKQQSESSLRMKLPYEVPL